MGRRRLLSYLFPATTHTSSCESPSMFSNINFGFEIYTICILILIFKLNSNFHFLTPSLDPLHGAATTQAKRRWWRPSPTTSAGDTGTSVCATLARGCPPFDVLIFLSIYMPPMRLLIETLKTSFYVLRLSLRISYVIASTYRSFISLFWLVVTRSKLSELNYPHLVFSFTLVQYFSGISRLFLPFGQ